MSLQLYYHIDLIKILFKTASVIILGNLFLKFGYNIGKLLYIIIPYFFVIFKPIDILKMIFPKQK